MDRRKAIINLSLSAAGIGLSSTFITAMSSCEVKKELSYSAGTFSAEEDRLVQELVELIIPTTDTPGAKDAGVNQYIDRVLTEVRSQPEIEVFLKGLSGLQQKSQELFKKDFISLKEQEQVQLLQQLEEESITNSGVHFFSLLKSMTIYGYYTSEIGATQELTYLHAAGTYKGDVPYEENGKNYY